ncbi:hypothetical protein ACROYT_G043492 [Oculina patagonica]
MFLAYRSIDDLTNAIKYVKEILHVLRECGNRLEECRINIVLATFYLGQRKYVEAKEHTESALLISTEIGDKKGEAFCYGNLGVVYESVGEYEKAKEYHERALAMKKEFGDRNGKATCYGKLGQVFQSVGEYRKTKGYLEKALKIKKEMGTETEKPVVMVSWEKCFNLLVNLRRQKNISRKHLRSFKKLATEKKKHPLMETLESRRSCSWKPRDCVHNKYAEANDYLKKALTLSKEIGDKKGEADVYGNLGNVFQLLGDYEKAREDLEKALTISKEIGDRNGEASINASLGVVFQSLGEYVEAEEYHKRALAISEGIGDVKKQSTCLSNLGWVKLQTGKIQEALSYLLPSIQKCEDLRGFLQDNDQFKISFSHEHAYPYMVLTELFYSAGNPTKVLYVSELRRARALVDLMSVQYSVENQISANSQSWVDIESVMDKELSCTCLYLSYFDKDIVLWILKARGVVHFRDVDGKEVIASKGLIKNLDEFFSNERFRSFGILREEHCEDRSLDDTERKPCEEDIREASRIGNDGKDNQDNLNQNHSLCHKLIIAPVVDLIESPEIIIVPERSLYNIPFAALPDESGKYLSETFRIRAIPSLTTLKLIQDSPADYHSQTGALIVGNPDVGRVRYKGRLKYISPLPCAESEANMIGDKGGAVGSRRQCDRAVYESFLRAPCWWEKCQ